MNGQPRERSTWCSGSQAHKRAAGPRPFVSTTSAIRCTLHKIIKVSCASSASIASLCVLSAAVVTAFSAAGTSHAATAPTDSWFLRSSRPLQSRNPTNPTSTGRRRTSVALSLIEPVSPPARSVRWRPRVPSTSWTKFQISVGAV